mgnify:CR=1 FL=1|jgi:uncharacterized protein HemX
MNKSILLLFTLLLSFSFLAQNTVDKDNSLEGQFVDVIDKSNRFEDYKVIKIFKLAALRKNILDSVTALEDQIAASQKTIDDQQVKIGGLEKTLQDTNENLSLSKEKEDGITFFGTIVKKSTYNSIMWFIIAALLLGLGYFIFRFKNSNAITKEANSKLAETETEFETHRSKKLEEIQQIRRKLQDEINKNRKTI